MHMLLGGGGGGGGGVLTRFWASHHFESQHPWHCWQQYPGGECDRSTRHSNWPHKRDLSRHPVQLLLKTKQDGLVANVDQIS